MNEGELGWLEDDLNKYCGILPVPKDICDNRKSLFWEKQLFAKFF